MLDLFDGKLTLTDILNTDISLLGQLRDAKLELLDQNNSKKERIAIGDTKGAQRIFKVAFKFF